MSVQYFSWSDEKNETLNTERGISFEEVVAHIERGHILEILEHPNQPRYPGQRIFILEMGDYAYLVPFVESETEIFPKTVIPSRKATNTYLRQRGEEVE